MTYLSNVLTTILAFVLISCGTGKSTVSQASEVTFKLNLLDRSDDTFKVQVFPPKLTADNTIFQFASTAPGTYQVMDIGRFVKAFKAYDKTGREIATHKISTNQYELTSPEKIKKIEYQIAETWDTPVNENNIYLMCGTSIERDHILINGQAVFGYFKGMQSSPLKIKLEYPEDWSIGTALKKSEKNYYSAKNYDHLVDSPFLLGNLSKSSMNVHGTSIDIYTYSKTGLIQSEQISESMKNMLLSASGFLNGLPVKRYTFLFHFEDKTNGAWEHSYSSEYVYKEDSWENLEKDILDVAAHEFFHVVTPLNIHSEIVDKFNFVTPVPSDHLWLYEGTTEWASHMMLFRSGQKSLTEYFKMLQKKTLISTNYFDPSNNLVNLAQTSYTPEGHLEYKNIYMKGALVAGLLDIKLLELSNGEKGLIDIINALAKKYGPDKPFKDATFFDEFTNETYPEIKAFFEAYVKGSEQLPLKEYYTLIGVDYDKTSAVFSLDQNPSESQLKLRKKWMQPIDLSQLELLNFKTEESFLKKVQTLDSTIETLYSVISGNKGVARNWDLFKFLFAPGAKLIPSGKNEEGTFQLRYLKPDDYIKNSGKWLVENGFIEKEIHRTTNTFGNITQVFSTYECFHNKSDRSPFMRGINSIQLLNDGERWWIVNIYWTQETIENIIPNKYLGKN